MFFLKHAIQNKTAEKDKYRPEVEEMVVGNKTLPGVAQSVQKILPKSPGVVKIVPEVK